MFVSESVRRGGKEIRINFFYFPKRLDIILHYFFLKKGAKNGQKLLDDVGTRSVGKAPKIVC